VSDAGGGSSDVTIVVLTAILDARAGEEDALAAVLARYVVLTRREPHCRNVDLVTSTTKPGRFLVVEKWEDDADARAHLDTELMAGMARDAVPLLEHAPTLDLYETISAHDLM
jgi:quinol monooxygenase YgiN